jgi:hypothetical protein
MLIINQSTDVNSININHYILAKLLKLATDRIKVTITCKCDCQIDTVNIDMFASDTCEKLIEQNVNYFIQDMQDCYDLNEIEYAITLEITK